MSEPPRTPHERPAETKTVEEPQPAPKSGLNLSLSQVAGGSLAAATAALLGSKLGTTGTIIGAALVSVISAVGGALYTASLRRTRDVVVRTREILPTGQWRVVSHTERRAAVARTGSDQDDRTDETEGTEGTGETAETDEDAKESLWHRVSWKAVAVVAAIVFVVAGVLTTVSELATGHETTANKVMHGGSRPDKKPTPVPSRSPSRSPSESSPSQSQSPTSTPTSRPTRSTSPSATPPSTPTEKPSEGTSPSGTPTGESAP